MSDKELPTFIFTLDKSIPDELNPNEDENIQFSFSNFSSHFDEHINKSIRGYADLRNDVVKISEYFVENDTTVMDLGCSQGSLIRKMKEQNTFSNNTQYLGVEINDSFSKHWVEEDNLKYLVDDIITMNFPNNLSMVTSLFTFQFIPERHRLPLMKKIFDNLIEGGSFVFSEKILSMSGKIQNIMEFMYLDYKKNYFTEKQILDKENELRHLAKLTNEDLLIKQLLDIGFRNIQSFWSNHNFVGYIALKQPSKSLEEK